MNFIIKNLYYKIYMSNYYQNHREQKIEYQLSYYYKNKQLIRDKQNNYYKTVYYPFKRFNVKHRVPPNREVKIETNVTLTF